VTEAELVGLDDFSDLAVIRVDVDPARLIPVTLADPGGLYVGQRVIAIGNPFGLASSMTTGTISALGRTLPSGQLLDPTLEPYNNPSIIQVDAEINPGNSGGPLLNSYGEVVGVNTAIRTESGTFQGVGFAVPVSTVLRVVPELIEKGQVEYSRLGVSSLSPEGGFSVAGLAEELNLPVTQGVLIQEVTPGSPADRAGLRGGTGQMMLRGQGILTGGDIVVAINGQFVSTMDDLVDYLVVNTRPGDEVTLTIIRNGETLEVPVTLDSR
jgi:S1-C subfamily serine protease